MSDSPMFPTGYGQVTRNLLNRFKKANIDTHCFGMQLGGMTLHWGKVGNIYLDFPVYHSIHNNENWGSKGSLVYWNNLIKPDIQAFLCDSFMIGHLFSNKFEEKDKMVKKFCEADKLKGKKLFYFPLDSHEVYEAAKPVIKGMDILVAMSKHGRRTLKKDMGLDSHYIPHGFDPLVYRPLPDSIINPIRKQNKWEDKFVVGCVSRNQGRKMLPFLIDAFKEFSEGKPDAILFFHCFPNEQGAGGHNLAQYAKKLGINKKVIFSGTPSPYIGVPESQINIIYNAMDMHVLPTSGEGFGLPLIESMACGVPNIMSDCTTARELIRNHGEIIKLSAKMHGEHNTLRAIIDTKDLVKKMDKIYYSKKLREKYSQEGRKFVLKNYTWDKVVRGWLELFEFGEIKEKFI